MWSRKGVGQTAEEPKFFRPRISPPEELRQTQEEADRVAGLQRPPAAQHQHQLVFLKACVAEVPRWSPNGPERALPRPGPGSSRPVFCSCLAA